MKRKEVEDVMGGPGAWDNVDQTDGPETHAHDHSRRQTLLTGSRRSTMQGRKMRRIPSIFLSGADSERGRAYDDVLQGDWAVDEQAVRMC